MGALNALDALLPGPEQPEAEPPPSPVGGRARGSRRSGAFNMLDELLPGPEQARPEPPPIPLRLSPPEGEPTARVLPLRSTGAAGALDAFLAGAPAPKPRRAPRAAPAERVRTTFKVSSDVLRAVRDAISRMAVEPGVRMTMDELTEKALQAELKRIARRRRDQARRAREAAERAEAERA
jgi:hypothetical protein